MGRASVDRGLVTRDRLLTAAADLVVESGWSAVSTRAVAARAGVPAGAVHYHFGSMDALLRAAVAEPLRAAVAAVTSALAPEVDLRSGVAALLESVAGQRPESPQSVLLAEVLLAATRDPALRQDVAEVLGALRAAVARWLEARGSADGSTATATATATVLVAALDALGVHRALDPDLDLAGVEDVLLRLVGVGGER